MRSGVAGGERGWLLGDQEFKKELLAQVPEKRGITTVPSWGRRMIYTPKGVVRAELGCLGWGEAELERRRKGDPEKVELAWRLRWETTITSNWIPPRLRMGAWTSVSNCLSRKQKGA